MSVCREDGEYQAVTDTVSGREGVVVGWGTEEVLVRFPRLGDLWVDPEDLEMSDGDFPALRNGVA